LQHVDIHSDQTLAIQIKSGDIKAFETIYHRYKARLYYYALSYLSVSDEVNEIIQNTFVSLWEHRLDINEAKSLKSFLFTITVNQVFNYLKHQVVQKEYASSYLNTTTEADLSTQKEIYFNDLNRYLEKIVEKLPDQQQRVFKMSRWEGLSNEEIARNLGISIRTAENLLYRATKSIKESLNDEKLLVLFIICYSTEVYLSI
jgi:RNA polymerase sigma-70 factor, ECF subfamily